MRELRRSGERRTGTLAGLCYLPVRRRVLAPILAIGLVVSLALAGRATDEGGSPEPPRWGLSLTDSTDVALVQEALLSLGAGTAAGSEHFENYVILGPALWARLQGSDVELLAPGKPMVLACPSVDTIRHYSARSFHDQELAALVRMPWFVNLGKRFASGDIRAATRLERYWYYVQIPFEIAGEPLTVASKEDEVLLLDCFEKQVMWMEMISDWMGADRPEAVSDWMRSFENE
jgi:hypothetical protein